MPTKPSDTDLLKNILENIHYPWRLDEHPWAERLFVQDVVERNPDLYNEGPGGRLIAALKEMFLRTMPSTPPRRGKRLDTQWGQFGMLAALYFAPLQFGLPAPGSLRDAWGRIDQSILYYAYGCDGSELSEQEIETYRLVGQEPEVAAASTLSDWHCKGLQKLANAISVHERHLETSPQRRSAALPRPVVAQAAQSRGRLRLRPKTILLVLTLTFLLALGLGGYKAQRIYRAGIVLREDILQLQALKSSSPMAGLLLKAGPSLSKTRQDFDRFSQEVQPVLWLGDWLGWVPGYGGDLASSRQLLGIADLFLKSTEQTYAGSRPLLAALGHSSHLDPSQMVGLLNQAQPQLGQARANFERLQELRAGLDVQRLSPRIRSLVEADLDPWLPVMDDGLTAATALPRFLGASSEGPKTYLLLAQNEDELRPTGGFITAVGTLVVENGKVVTLKFADSGEMDNWDRPYPLAPWQLEQYMNSPVLILRDTNWFPDFPTAALYAESLYAYSSSHSVDGVIAFDQHLLVFLLEALGTIPVDGAPEPVDAAHVIAFMRSSKTPPADGPLPAGWSRKGFMDRIASAILMKVFQEQDVPWEQLSSAFLQSLDQGHLLLQLDDPDLDQVMARHGWDGALRYSGGDFLMVVDANIGFNKTNAVVRTALSYGVDLSQPAYPVGTLTVTHENDAAADVPCVQWPDERAPGEKDYPIDACYWNYMRVYAPAGAKLLDATRQKVPAEWMILHQGVDAPVDVLDEELDGLQAFGALMVVPGGQALTSTFHFRLPEAVLITSGGQTTYHLKIKKQPGTSALPLTIRVQLPAGARLISSSLQGVRQKDALLIQTDLRSDVVLDLVFSVRYHLSD